MKIDFTRALTLDCHDKEVVTQYTRQVHREEGHRGEPSVHFGALKEIYLTPSCIIANIAILTMIKGLVRD